MPDIGLPRPRRGGHVAHCTCYNCVHGERDELRAEVAKLREALGVIRSGEDPISRYPDGTPYMLDLEDTQALARRVLAGEGGVGVLSLS